MNKDLGDCSRKCALRDLNSHVGCEAMLLHKTGIYSLKGAKMTKLDTATWKSIGAMNETIQRLRRDNAALREALQAAVASEVLPKVEDLAARAAIRQAEGEK